MRSTTVTPFSFRVGEGGENDSALPQLQSIVLEEGALAGSNVALEGNGLAMCRGEEEEL